MMRKILGEWGWGNDPSVVWPASEEENTCLCADKVQYLLTVKDGISYIYEYTTSWCIDAM